MIIYRMSWNSCWREDGSVRAVLKNRCRQDRGAGWGNRIGEVETSGPLSRYAGGGLGRGLFRVAKVKNPHPGPPPGVPGEG